MLLIVPCSLAFTFINWLDLQLSMNFALQVLSYLSFISLFIYLIIIFFIDKSDGFLNLNFLFNFYRFIILVELFLLAFFSSDIFLYYNLVWFKSDGIFSLNLFNWYINQFSFLIDRSSLVFSVTTYIIGYFTNRYSFIYLKSDKNRTSFLKFLNLFIISMLFLVKTNCILVVVLSWEFLGISSFFLIGHYYNRPYSLKSAFKAFSFNRVSDLFLFLFTVIYLYNYNSFEVFIVNEKRCFLEFISFFFLIITASIKSAQGIFFFWLPDSMEAPIPASALIHSATLVAAGIYLCIRFYNVINYYYLLQVFLILSGLMSATIFSFIAFLQTDIKRLLAYSTIANCGFIYFLLGSKLVDTALVYFSVHGLLKSSLFMLFGYLIVYNNHVQDFQF